MASKKKAKGRISNPRRGNRLTDSTPLESVTFDGKEYTKAEWLKAIKAGLKTRAGGIIRLAPAGPGTGGVWQVRLVDAFGNPVDYAFPADSRYFKGSGTGPSWSAV